MIVECICLYFEEGGDDKAVHNSLIWSIFHCPSLPLLLPNTPSKVSMREGDFKRDRKSNMAARDSADSREDVDFTDEGEFAEVIRLIKKIYDILNRKTFRVHKEKEAFNEVAKKLEHVHFAETLKLNIGGQLFTTSLATVRKDPGSILHGMFSGRFDSKPAEDGSYFIDRDGTHFRYILNYLRTGQLIVPEDKIIRRELFTEAKSSNPVLLKIPAFCQWNNAKL